MSFQQINISATIKAGSKKVWDYYTLPQHITQWNFAIESWRCPFAENNLTVGGKYKARMEAKDGSFGFDFEATYNEIVDGRSFTYTMPDGRKVSVDFIDNGDQTDVNIVFDAETMNSIELQQQGWQAILNNFKKYAEAQ